MTIHVTVLDPDRIRIHGKDIEDPAPALKAKINYKWHDERLIELELPIYAYGIGLGELIRSLEMVGFPTKTLKELFPTGGIIWWEDDIKIALSFAKEALDSVIKNQEKLSKPERGIFGSPGSRFDSAYQDLAELIAKCELALAKKTKISVG